MEVWGWGAREKVETLNEMYLRWVLGVERCTPGYLLRKELQRVLKGRSGLRAWGFEKKLEEGECGELARLCWGEMKERPRRGKVLGGWEDERKQFFEGMWWTVEEVERLRERGELRG